MVFCHPATQHSIPSNLGSIRRTTFAKPLWGWHPSSAKFYEYPSPKWVLRDVGLEAVEIGVVSNVPDLYARVNAS